MDEFTCTIFMPLCETCKVTLIGSISCERSTTYGMADNKIREPRNARDSSAPKNHT